MKNADLGGRRKVRSGRQTIFNSVAQPQPAARGADGDGGADDVESKCSWEYVKYGSSVRSSAG